MIISHEHKFIFLKTRKTAGTSIELALSDLCGARDIITSPRPTRRCAPTDAARRTGGCMAGGRVPPLLATPLLQIHRAGLRFLQSYTGGRGQGAAQRRHRLAQLFQIRLRPQSLGPASLLVSPPLSPPQGQAAVCHLYSFGPTGAHQQLRDLFDWRGACGRFCRTLRNSRTGLAARAGSG